MVRKQEKLKRRANDILENDALGESEKASQIKDLYKKSNREEKVAECCVLARLKLHRSRSSTSRRPRRALTGPRSNV